ncbi:MAG: methylated-DNA--[protein]-cysteine S-methyltransferase [Acidobacteriota bacterium]|nr:methylated-DNA--[protein]-cysteine S-methyltransferase [Acidobacteriota bacterium]
MVDPATEAEISAQEEPVEPDRVLIPSALGTLGVQLTGDAVTRVVIVPKGRERKKYKPFGELKRRERNEVMDEVLGRFSEYLAGARRRLGLEYALADDTDEFLREVLEKASEIPYGETWTYQQLAAETGRSDAYRQVLAVLQTNPLPLVVPCHRVVTAKSGPGSYVAGVKKKIWLLKMEQRGLTL